MTDFDVVIIGGGVGGLTLALKLAQANIHVLVIEKANQPGKIYKGELLQPKSLENFSEMGVVEEIVANSWPLSTIHTYEMKERKDGSLRTELYIPLHYHRLYSSFPLARMIPHEKLKGLLLSKAKTYHSFTYWNPATFQGFSKVNEQNNEFNEAIIRYKSGYRRITSSFFVGAEGRVSLMRKAMKEHGVTTHYNHQFLTVTFQRPEVFKEARMYATHREFIGLFPLPDNKVRSVMLIKPGDYKRMKDEGLHTFYEPFERFVPELTGYLESITSWKDIQLMIPIRHKTQQYVKGNAAIIGDAAHTVHPMAGEGMNMAIQDGAILGELLTWMYKERTRQPQYLKLYEKVRKKRADRMSHLSHLSAMAYTWPARWYQQGRMFALKRLERHPVLHDKHMLNISGIGWWPYNGLDILRFFGLAKAYSLKRLKKKQRENIYSSHDDYPWKAK
ncbi:FAD-dependent monooxygenase [Bacillus sp. A116_S68]|nr:FAD-dependent monooxygenase [Bacillus sp. A116_S68]